MLRQRIACLTIILITAASVLQFAFLNEVRTKYTAGPTRQQCTFFALHLVPYYVFSEDFHLYTVRGRRILDRGWKGNLLNGRHPSPNDYASPVQAAIGMLSAKTLGDPVWYSLMMFFMCAFAWSTLFLIADRFLEKRLNRYLLALAVLATVLFQPEELNLWRGPPGYSIWIFSRALRVATTGWTHPLLLSALIVLSGLFSARAPRRLSLSLFALFSILLSLSDSWSFLFLMFSSVAWMLFIFPRAARSQFKTCLVIATLLILSLGLQRLFSRGLSPDALFRAGIGPLWLQSPFGYHLNGADFWKESRSALMMGLILLCSGLTEREPYRVTRQIALLAGTSLFGFCAVLFAISRVGIEKYQASEFLMRQSFCLWFCVLCGGLYAMECLVRRLAQKWEARKALQDHLVEGMFAALLGLTMYQAYAGVHTFIFRYAAGSFVLPSSEENLEKWMARLPKKGEGLTVATLSPEINYLFAFWTHADLLLPVGFPYQFNGTNSEIASDAAKIFRFYGATRDIWRHFNLLAQPSDQDDWRNSRLLSAREGLLYYLYHRAIFASGYERGKQGRSNLEAVAHHLDPQDPEPLRPDLVVLDEVSRGVGSPRLEGYRRVFESEGLEVWSRSQGLN